MLLPSAHFRAPANPSKLSPDTCGHFFFLSPHALPRPFLLFPEAQKNEQTKKSRQENRLIAAAALPNGAAISPSTSTAGGGLANQRRAALLPWASEPCESYDLLLLSSQFLHFFPTCMAWHAPMAQGPFSLPLFSQLRQPKQLSVAPRPTATLVIRQGG